MASYYVSPNGSNNNSGLLEEPFASLQHAHDIAKPGDTIYMRGGVYELTSEVRLTHDGTSGNPITVTNYQDEVPILDGSSMSGGYVVNMSSASWNHINGLEIRNGPEGGLMIQGQSHFNTVEQLNVHHNGWNSEWEGKGIVMFGAGSNNLLLNNDSHHNQDLNLDNADGFQVDTTGTGNVLRGNRAWANSDDGFDFFNVHDNTDAAPLVIEGNWAFDNGYANDGSVAGDGNGFKLGGAREGTSGTSGGHIVSHNVAWGNRAIGFDENSASDPITLENNTAYNNDLYNFGFWEGEHTFRNNLSAGTGRVAASGSSEGNSWTMPVKVDSSDFVSLDDSTARGDRAADGSLPTTQFLHLANGSDLVDLGAIQTAAPSGGVDPIEVSDTPSTPSEPETKPVSGNASGPGQAPISQPDDSSTGIDASGATTSPGSSTGTVPAEAAASDDSSTETVPAEAATSDGSSAWTGASHSGRGGFHAGRDGDMSHAAARADRMADYGGGDKGSEGSSVDRTLASVRDAFSFGSESKLLATTSDKTAITGNGFAQNHDNVGDNVGKGGGAETSGLRSIDAFDFGGLQDRPHFDNSFAGFRSGGLSSDTFSAGRAAHDRSDHVTYDSSTGSLSFDNNENGGASQMQFAAHFPWQHDTL